MASCVKSAFSISVGVMLLVLLARTAWADALQGAQGEEEVRRECSENFFSMIAVGECIERKAQASETALKEAEKKLRAALDKWIEDERFIRLAKTKLTASSKAFLRYREAQCAFARSLHGSAISHGMLRNACIAEQNNRRAAQIVAYAAGVPQREDEDAEKAEERDCASIQEQGLLAPACVSVLERMRKREAGATSQAPSRENIEKAKEPEEQRCRPDPMQEEDLQDMDAAWRRAVAQIRECEARRETQRKAGQENQQGAN
ncbi:MAG: DUF1311 domain-containing protein [Zoogloeaceae bacterium]|jgi:uncharacterized protein YecT (DUF1311 family)|nr:DUF1311 domain-containing protein [Zoogloeaceae bacterium]